MTHCLVCFDPIVLTVTWSNVIQIANRKNICSKCQTDLQQISGELCRVCSRISKSTLCYDCQRWEIYYDGEDPLQQNWSIYLYNDVMKELITRWKYRGDYVLGYTFKSIVKEYFIQYIKPLHKEISVVPIPLSYDRLIERGFNQAEMLAQFIPAQQELIFQRLLNEKQSKKTRIERMMVKNPFNLKKSLHIPVVLVDDIYTTGRTLRHAAQLLKEAGCPAVYALTVCRG